MQAACRVECSDNTCRMIREKFAIGCLPTGCAVQLHGANWKNELDRISPKSVVPVVVAALISLGRDTRPYDSAGTDAMGNRLISQSASWNGVPLSNRHTGVRGKEAEGSFATFISGVGNNTRGGDVGLSSCRVYALLLLTTPAIYRLNAGAFFVCDAALTSPGRHMLRLYQATLDQYMDRNNAADPVSK